MGKKPIYLSFYTALIESYHLQGEPQLCACLQRGGALFRLSRTRISDCNALLPGTKFVVALSNSRLSKLLPIIESAFATALGFQEQPKRPMAVGTPNSATE